MPVNQVEKDLSLGWLVSLKMNVAIRSPVIDTAVKKPVAGKNII